MSAGPGHADGAAVGPGTGCRRHRVAGPPPPHRAGHRVGRTADQTAGAGKVGYSTPETCWTTRMTWQE